MGAGVLMRAIEGLHRHHQVYSRVWSSSISSGGKHRTTPRHSRENNRIHEDRSDSAPPLPAKKPFSRTAHGVTWDDPYHWLSSADDPDVLQHLERENSYTLATMRHTLPLQAQLKAEMASRLTEDQASPPERWGPWLYYARIPSGEEYPIYFRRHLITKRETWIQSFKSHISKLMGSNNECFGIEQVLLDLNKIVQEHGYVHLGMCKISRDHNFLAYTLDLCGKELFTLFVKDLRTGHILSKPRVNGVVSVEWARDSSTLLYTTADDMLRPFRVFRHTLGSKKEDTLLLEEKDSHNFVDVSRTKDWQFMTINVNSKTSSEVYLVDASGHIDDLKVVEKRRPGLEYFVEHHCGILLILTNFSGPFSSTPSSDYNLFICPCETPGIENWKPVMMENTNMITYDMDIFETHLVLYQRKEGLPCISVLDMPITCDVEKDNVKGMQPCILSLPKGVCTITPGLNQDFYSSTLRLSISSPIMPDALLDYDLSSKFYTVLQQDELDAAKFSPCECLKGHGKVALREEIDLIDETNKTSLSGDTHKYVFDLSAHYVCDHVKVPSVGMADVPLTIVHPRKLKRNGKNPALLIGYGSYGEVLDVKWCSDHFSLLARGWVLAFAHVRGGGELGKSWHHSGRLFEKKNSIMDFLACADFLIDNGYAQNDCLAAKGVSAGGLLVAAATNMRPDLFSAIILKVPFLDVCNTMLDENLALTVPEYEEWGDPSNVNVFKYIRSYSPYDNIKEEAVYPSMLVLSSFMDTRVGYWEAAKWVARVRSDAVCHSHRPILLKMDMNSGHFREGGLYRHLDDSALECAFLLKMADGRRPGPDVSWE